MSKTRELYAPSNFDEQEPMDDMSVGWFISAAQDVDLEHQQGIWEDWQRDMLFECINPSSPISSEELYKEMREELKRAPGQEKDRSPVLDAAGLLDEAWADLKEHVLQQEELQYSQPENEKPRG